MKLILAVTRIWFLEVDKCKFDILLSSILAVFQSSSQSALFIFKFYIRSPVKEKTVYWLQWLQVLPVIEYSETLHAVDDCSPNQIAVIPLYFHCTSTVLPLQILAVYTGANKDPPGRDFLRQISTVFGTFLKNYLRYRNFIYLIGKP